MHLGIAQCHIPFLGLCDLVFGIIMPEAFEIGIPNLVCLCILGWWSVRYHLQFTVVTLTSDRF